MALKRLNVFWQVFIEEDELLIYSRSKGGFVLTWTITCGNGISIEEYPRCPCNKEFKRRTRVNRYSEGRTPKVLKRLPSFSVIKLRKAREIH